MMASKVLILHFLEETRRAHTLLASFEQGVAAQGHTVTVKSAHDEALHLAFYDYIAVLCAPRSPFSSRIPDAVGEVLSSNGSVAGKKACALVLQHGLFASKACSALMAAMEKEGMVIDYFDLISNAEQARRVATRIG